MGLVEALVLVTLSLLLVWLVDRDRRESDERND